MRVDTAIIGGGLSALVCGLRLQREGVRTCVISSGQSSLFFFSGAFGLLSRLPDGSYIDRPFDALPSLPASHPYSRTGADNVRRYASLIPGLFTSCGVRLNGCGETNGWRFLAAGGMKRAWASLPDLDLFGSERPLTGKKVLVVRIPGFLDQFPVLVAESLKKMGNVCRIADVTVPEFSALTGTSGVVRSISIAKMMEQPEVLDAFIRALSDAVSDSEVAVLPQVFGLKSDDALRQVRDTVPSEVLFFNTMTPSVPGNRLYSQLRTAYEDAGGVFVPGTARSADVVRDMVMSVTVEGMEECVEADSFVLATGSFVSRGLQSSPETISEAVFGLDVDFNEDRGEWISGDMDDRQPFNTYGVRTDASFHPSLGGVTISNLYAAGSVLSGADSLYEGSGAGVAVVTAMRVADLILGR